MSREGTMVCLSLPALFVAVFQLPFAHLADRTGKKKMGILGGLLIGLAFLGFLTTTLVEPGPGRFVAVICVSLFAIGLCMQTSSWFALIQPMIPGPIRASFFARLRVNYQAVTVILGLVCSAILGWQSSPSIFGGIFLVFFLMVIIWFFLYLRLPEVEKFDPALPSFRTALGNVIRSQAYLPFCAYAFLLALFTGSCPVLFGMIEKKVLHLSDGIVVLLANVRMLGAILGFFIGGKIVERMGTKAMFLVCHFCFGAIMFLFLWRDASGGAIIPILLILEGLFGMVFAASSVAFTVEMYALIPSAGKSLSTSVFLTLQGTGVALSGLLPAWAIHLGMFRETWTLAGTQRSDYDALLLICGTFVIVVAVTLGLVPSVSGKIQGPSLN